MTDTGAPADLGSTAAPPAIGRRRPFRRLTLVPLATFAAAAAMVVVVAALGHRAASLSDTMRFEVIAGDVVSRLVDRLAAQVTVLDGVGALHNVDPADFDSNRLEAYVRELSLRRAHPGVTSIGFARRTSAAFQDERAAEISRMYGTSVQVTPRIAVGEGYPVTLMESYDGGERRALGFDLASEDGRRAAMRRAAESGRPAATGKVTMYARPGEPRVDGFVIFRPVYTRGAPAADADSRLRRLVGFAFAPIRAAEFFAAVLSGAPLRYAAVEIVDGAGEGAAVLYATDAALPAGRQLHVAPIEVAGHVYEVRVASRPAYDATASARLVYPFAGLGLLLAAAAGGLVRQSMSVRLREEEERAAALQALRDKDLLLQEMKHRIKNALARVQAVARQTARGATGIEEFLTAFEARLAAMSATHDLLTRSRWEGADLREVLTAEIEPVLGPESDAILLDGPAVHLDARQVLAFGLTVHELATNAVKYGAVTRPGGRLAIRWRTPPAPSGRGVVVEMEWAEHRAPGAPPPEPAAAGHRGFGSRLIETTVQRELAGTFQRRLDGTGLVCRIVFPAG